MQNQSRNIPENWAPRFFTIWGGQAFSLFGSALVQFALVWHLARETGSATILAMALNFMLSPASALLPLVVTKVFEKGALELGWVQSLFGVGIITGGITLSVWGGFKRRIVTSLIGILGIGIGILLIGIVSTDLFSLLLVTMFLVGFAQVFANGPLGAIMQSTIAPEMQGRVFSLLGAGAMAMMPLSLMIAGPVSDYFGIRVWFIFGGAVTILMTIAASFIPAIMNIESNHGDATAPTE